VTDILELLQKQWQKPDPKVDADALCWEAAEEILHLRAENEELKQRIPAPAPETK
jgi:hypothetical protein